MKQRWLAALLVLGLVTALVSFIDPEPADSTRASVAIAEKPATAADASRASATAEQQSTHITNPASIGSVASSPTPPSSVDQPDELTHFVTGFDEEQGREYCERAASIQHAQERARLESEPRDEGWAPSMEQMLQQHFATELRDQYDALKIGCRKTWCEVQLSGTQPEAYARAQRALNEVPSQPWSGLIHKGGGGESTGTRWTQRAMLVTPAFRAAEMWQVRPRPEPPDDLSRATPENLSAGEAQAICSAWHAWRQRREQSAMEAEEKDPRWAYATEEQLLLTLNKLPIDFTDVKIDCRTTHCKISGKARHESLSALQSWIDTVTSKQPKGLDEFSGYRADFTDKMNPASFEIVLNRHTPLVPSNT